MNSIISDKTGYTNEAERFFNCYSNGFGNIVNAMMESSNTSVEYKLILTNDQGEKMIFEGGLTCGYKGEGSNATIRVLRKAGFDIEDEFVYKNQAFNINR